MTRDEAIETAFKTQAECVKMSCSPKDRLMCATADVDTCIALGMLKLDEPSRLTDEFRQSEPSGMIGKIRTFMRDCGLGHMSPAQLDNALVRARLKIVEE